MASLFDPPVWCFSILTKKLEDVKVLSTSKQENNFHFFEFKPEGRERRAADGGGEHTIYPEELWASQRSSGRSRGGGHMLHVRPEHNCGDEDGRAILVSKCTPGSKEADEPVGHAETQHTFVCSGRTWDMRHVA